MNKDKLNKKHLHLYARPIFPDFNKFLDHFTGVDQNSVISASELQTLKSHYFAPDAWDKKTTFLISEDDKKYLNL